MRYLRKVLSLQGLFVLVAIVYLTSAVRAWRANAKAELDKSQDIPILVSPSVQPGKGQALLIKLTNISGGRVGVRLSLYNDLDEAPIETTDIDGINPKATITHVYTPPQGKLAVNGAMFDAPAAVRALIQPLHGGEANPIRKIVANLYVVTLKPVPANGPPPSCSS